MIDLITFLKQQPDGAKRKMFGYQWNDRFIIKMFKDEQNAVVFAYWTEFNKSKSLLDHVNDYFSLPGLLGCTIGNPVECRSDLGIYYPRIFRRGLDQNLSTKIYRFQNFETSTLNQSIVSTSILLRKLNSIFETISFDTSNFKTFGHELRNLLILACTEVEAAWSGILSSNNYNLHRNYTTNDYVKILKPLYLKGYKVSFKLYPNIPPIAPFEQWNSNSPTQSLTWYDSYNKTKHDRETHSNLASLEAVLQSISAVIIMMYAQFGPNENMWTQPEFIGINLECPEHEVKDYYIPNSSPSSDKPHVWVKADFKF